MHLPSTCGAPTACVDSVHRAVFLSFIFCALTFCGLAARLTIQSPCQHHGGPFSPLWRALRIRLRLHTIVTGIAVDTGFILSSLIVTGPHLTQPRLPSVRGYNA